MITENEKIIDFEVYKYVFPNLLHLTALMVVLLITVVFCIICQNCGQKIDIEKTLKNSNFNFPNYKYDNEGKLLQEGKK